MYMARHQLAHRPSQPNHSHRHRRRRWDGVFVRCGHTRRARGHEPPASRRSARRDGGTAARGARLGCERSALEAAAAAGDVHLVGDDGAAHVLDRQAACGLGGRAGEGRAAGGYENDSLEGPGKVVPLRVATQLPSSALSPASHALSGRAARSRCPFPVPRLARIPTRTLGCAADARGKSTIHVLVYMYMYMCERALPPALRTRLKRLRVVAVAQPPRQHGHRLLVFRQALPAPRLPEVQRQQAAKSGGPAASPPPPPQSGLCGSRGAGLVRRHRATQHSVFRGERRPCLSHEFGQSRSWQADRGVDNATRLLEAMESM